MTQKVIADLYTLCFVDCNPSICVILSNKTDNKTTKKLQVSNLNIKYWQKSPTQNTGTTWCKSQNPNKKNQKSNRTYGKSNSVPTNLWASSELWAQHSAFTQQRHEQKTLDKNLKPKTSLSDVIMVADWLVNCYSFRWWLIRVCESWVVIIYEASQL